VSTVKERTVKFPGIAMASVLALAAAPAVVAGDQGDAHKPSEWIRSMDADGDGSVTEQEFQAGRTGQFAQQDADGDGTVTADELAKWKETHQGADVPAAKEITDDDNKEDYDSETDRMFDELDANGDGALTEDEMKTAREGGAAAVFSGGADLRTEGARPND
jgi:Ca2+-binding EF-hand superfamily protein